MAPVSADETLIDWSPEHVARHVIYREIQFVTQATLTALSKNGLEACLFGSAAAAIYGMEHRIPKVCSHSVSETDVTYCD